MLLIAVIMENFILRILSIITEKSEIRLFI